MEENKIEILVSPEDQWILTKYKWTFSRGYLQSNINDKPYPMHRFIMIEILKLDLTRHDFVDHINSIRHDNRRENLRVVSAALNAQNHKKRKDAFSEYYGVSTSEFYGFSVTLKINGENKMAYYENELHAAYQYDLWIKQYNKLNVKINNIEIPQDFVEYSKKHKILNLPRNISKNGISFAVRVNEIYYGSFKTVELAEKRLIEVKQQLETERIAQILNESIKRNSKGEAIIIWRNKEILVDDEDYYKLIVNKITMSQGYAVIMINKYIRLHRFVMNYYGPNCLDHVDHIDGNKLNNKKSNLRIVSPKKNAMNKASRKNSTSKYLGVYRDKSRDKWMARIESNFLGRFNDEIEAAKIRDEATLRYYGKHGRLNLPIIFLNNFSSSRYAFSLI